MAIKVGILVISDKGSQGLREDQCAPALKQFLNPSTYEVLHVDIVPDEPKAIMNKLSDWADNLRLDLVLTSGGTGVSPRDVTPEATLKILDREIPGIAEAMRTESLKKTAMAVLSRSVAGIRKGTLIVNLPGSPKGAIENLEAVVKAFPHAVKKIQGDMSDCAVTPSPKAEKEPASR